MRACGARPSGGVSRWEMALRGNAGNNVGGDFLEGTRSPRPDCKAGGKLRHNIIIRGKRTPGGLVGQSLGGSKVSLAGVPSPPLRGGLAQDRWPTGNMPGWSDGAIAGVRSPPLRGGEPVGDGLAGKTRG